MKKVILILLPLFMAGYGKAQTRDYFAAADSCLKLKDYACAADNYELYLKTDPESNGVAYMLAKARATRGDKEKTFTALELYVKNNGLNNNPFFCEQLLKEKNLLIVLQWRLLIKTKKN